MSAPLLWIMIPLAAAGLFLFLWDERMLAILASVLAAFLVVAALVPIDTAFTLGPLSFNIIPSMNILGRSLSLTTADEPLLMLIYGASFVWFVASAAARVARRLIPLGLVITALMVASLAVEPFLYAALLIEMAVLLAVPMLVTPGAGPRRGVLRFVIFQSLAMPFILFSGWLLAGIEANPGDQNLVLQAAVLLGLGFIFLLAIFPLSTWMPLLAEESTPYLSGFIFWIFPTAGLLFLTGFIDRYTWMHTSTVMPAVLTFTGVLMVAAGGILAAFQRNLGRILAYGILMETGFSLLALSTNSLAGLGLFFAQFVPRLIGLATWSFALTSLSRWVPSLDFHDIQGRLRTSPYASIGLLVASLSMVGFPFFAGFPLRQALMEMLSLPALGGMLWIFAGGLGMAIAVVRTLAVLAMSPEGTAWSVAENFAEKVLLIIGCVLLVLLGMFPQWVILLAQRIPAMFQHIGL